MAGGAAVAEAGLPTAPLTWNDVSALASAMYAAYLQTRSSLNSPDLSLGAADGTYIEVVSCRWVMCGWRSGARRAIVRWGADVV